MIIIIALVFNRANVYGQMPTGTKDSIVRRISPEEKILAQGVDSVLESLNYSRENRRVEIDTANRGANIPLGDYIGRLIIQHIHTIYEALNSTKNSEEGLIIVSASGIVCCTNSNLPDKKFSFTRSKKYTTTFDLVQKSDDTSSFWDSTAKPILVTLGAVAVIALFFLIRG